jgi:hypothetical protein
MSDFQIFHIFRAANLMLLMYTRPLFGLIKQSFEYELDFSDVIIIIKKVQSQAHRESKQKRNNFIQYSPWI